MEGYLRAASQISRLAVGDRNASATSATYKIGRTASQMRHVDGAPMGTRGGIVGHAHLPGRRRLRHQDVDALRAARRALRPQLDDRVWTSRNRSRSRSTASASALLDLNTRMSETDPKNSLELETPPIHIKAGPQRVSAAFIQRLDGPVDDLLVPLENTLADVSISFGVTALPHLRDLTILGPVDVTGVSDTPSRRMIFTCRPTTRSEEETVRRRDRQAAGDAGVSAARRRRTTCRTRCSSTSRAARRATSRAASAWRCSRSWSARASCSGSSRRRTLVQAPRRSATYRISDQDLASRLSFFLWGTVPDAELIKAASAGALRTPPASRSRSAACSPTSAPKRCRRASRRQWLRLQDLDKIFPDYLLYPQYDDTLAQAMTARDRALLRQPRPRGPQRARPADGRLHVRQRAAGEALRHPERHRQRVPPRARCRSIAAASSARAAS